MAEPLILYADDDASSRHTVQTALKNANMKVLLAASGSEALEVWRKNHLDLIILDVMMTDMTGFEVCEYIRQVSPVPIMMLTGMSRDWTGSFVYAWLIGTLCLAIAFCLLLITPRPVRNPEAPRPEPAPTFAS